MTLADANPIQNHGEVFTRRWVVEVLLDLAGYTSDRDLAKVRLVEPSCGSGAFLGPAVERLIASAAASDCDFAALSDSVRAYDLQIGHVEVSRSICRDLLAQAGATEDLAARLAETWVRHGDFLLSGVDLWSEGEDLRADVVVGNPPYIRYDELPESVAAQYRQTWSTMRGRGDIYVGFIERSLGILKPGGKIGFICADRWMRNQYGAQLRKLITSRYAVEHIWTMHDVDAFETQVSAYPAITVLSNNLQAEACVADTTFDFGPSGAFALAEATREAHFDAVLWCRREGPSASALVRGRRPLAHRLSREARPDRAPQRQIPVRCMTRTRTKVSIGVATGADKVYVTKDPNAAEADRMLPLAMRRDLMSGTFEWQGNYLVNPWADDGSLVALNDYPRMAAYLSQHPSLRERFVAKKAPGPGTALSIRSTRR